MGGNVRVSLLPETRKQETERKSSPKKRRFSHYLLDPLLTEREVSWSTKHFLTHLKKYINENPKEERKVIKNDSIQLFVSN